MNKLKYILVLAICGASINTFALTAQCSKRPNVVYHCCLIGDASRANVGLSTFWSPGSSCPTTIEDFKAYRGEVNQYSFGMQLRFARHV